MAAKKESGAAPAATGTTPVIENRNQEGFDQIDNLPQEDQIVKSERSRASQLQWLLSHCGGMNGFVDEIRKICPKFDKTILSKAKNADSYGVELRDDILKHLWLTYAPEEYFRRKRHSDGHRLTKRLYCRLEDDLYEQFIKKSRIDGYTNSNDCIADLIRDYLDRFTF